MSGKMQAKFYITLLFWQFNGAFLVYDAFFVKIYAFFLGKCIFAQILTVFQVWLPNDFLLLSWSSLFLAKKKLYGPNSVFVKVLFREFKKTLNLILTAPSPDRRPLAYLKNKGL